MGPEFRADAGVGAEGEPRAQLGRQGGVDGQEGVP